MTDLQNDLINRAKISEFLQKYDEAAKHNLDSYKDAQAAESEKMLRMMEIMQGKKKKEEE